MELLLFCSHTATLPVRVHDSDILLCDEKYTFSCGSAFFCPELILMTGVGWSSIFFLWLK